jgi:hypothetical protein
VKIFELFLWVMCFEVCMSDLSSGVVGCVRGVVVVYDVVDFYGMLFKCGSFEKMCVKVNSGKVKLFDNHNTNNYYNTHTHIKIIHSLTTNNNNKIIKTNLFNTKNNRHTPTIHHLIRTPIQIIRIHQSVQKHELRIDPARVVALDMGRTHALVALGNPRLHANGTGRDADLRDHPFAFIEHPKGFRAGEPRRIDVFV